MNAGVLIDDYYRDLVENETVLDLMGNVFWGYDRIDYEGTDKEITRIVRENGKNYTIIPQRLIDGWLAKVYFTNLESELPIQFWAEMSTIIEELAVIYTILYREDLLLSGYKIWPSLRLSEYLVELAEISKNKAEAILEYTKEFKNKYSNSELFSLTKKC